MGIHSAQLTAREAHEVKAWDDDGVLERCNTWVQRVIHVIDGPNTRHAESVYDALAGDAASGHSVLEVGCGEGQATARLLRDRPARVLSIDISKRMVAAARAVVDDDRVEFRVQSAMQPLQERFNLIAGRAILHHLDFHEFLMRTYRDNLLPGGRMLFMEPMGHPMAVAFHLLVPSAHSPDERLLRRADFHWMQRQFPNVRLHGINLLSFPAGVVSSFLFGAPDNRLMRAADRLDRRALQAVPELAAFSRLATIVIDKPAQGPASA